MAEYELFYGVARMSWLQACWHLLTRKGIYVFIVFASAYLDASHLSGALCRSCKAWLMSHDHDAQMHLCTVVFPSHTRYKFHVQTYIFITLLRVSSLFPLAGMSKTLFCKCPWHDYEGGMDKLAHDYARPREYGRILSQCIFLSLPPSTSRLTRLRHLQTCEWCIIPVQKACF